MKGSNFILHVPLLLLHKGCSVDLQESNLEDPLTDIFLAFLLLVVADTFLGGIFKWLQYKDHALLERMQYLR